MVVEVSLFWVFVFWAGTFVAGLTIGASALRWPSTWHRNVMADSILGKMRDSHEFDRSLLDSRLLRPSTSLEGASSRPPDPANAWGLANSEKSSENGPPMVDAPPHERR